MSCLLSILTFETESESDNPSSSSSTPPVTSDQAAAMMMQASACHIFTWILCLQLHDQASSVRETMHCNLMVGSNDDDDGDSGRASLLHFLPACN